MRKKKMQNCAFSCVFVFQILIFCNFETRNRIVFLMQVCLRGGVWMSGVCADNTLCFSFICGLFRDVDSVKMRCEYYVYLLVEERKILMQPM